MFVLCRKARNPFLAAMLAFAAIATILPSAPASAQGLFDALFGRRPAPPPLPPSTHAYIDPFGHPGRNPFERTIRPEEPQESAGRVQTYCVRLCDGRFFPVQRSQNTTLAETCRSFCPAAQTRTFTGGSIDRAIASDGTRYANLQNAHLYRARVVEDCTCNGRDPFGVARVDVNADPTLRAGDVVVTSKGMMAVTGARHAAAQFTPIEAYRGLPPELRRMLSAMPIAPVTQPIDAAAYIAPARAAANADGRSAQLSR